MTRSMRKRFPARSYSWEQHRTSHIRTVTLTKTPSGLGFHIIGGEDGAGIFVSYIIPGGLADFNGQLQQGDQILGVNGIDLTTATHEKAVAALKGPDKILEIEVEHNIKEYNELNKKITAIKKELSSTISRTSIQRNIDTRKKSIYVRALFDYDPKNDDGLPSRGIAFNFGDVLHATNASDIEWWQAKKVIGQHEEELGIIPSHKRWERKKRARDRSIKFHQGNTPCLLNKSLAVDEKKKNFSWKLPFRKSKKNKFNESTESFFTQELKTVLTYEKVEKIEIDYPRPIIILGLLKDRIIDDLINEFSEKFTTCVPHTTRAKRSHEETGLYHFVTREQMELDIQNQLFIEVGQLDNNLYGTSIASVKKVFEKKKHCVLDVSGNAIKRLQAVSIYPIAIFIKPKSVDSIMEMVKRINEKQASKMYEHYMNIEQEFKSYFTGDTPEEIDASVKSIIQEQSQPNIWVSSDDQQL